MGLLDLWGARTENYKIKILAQDLKPEPSAYDANLQSVATRADIYIEHLNISRVLLELAIKFTCTVYHVVDEASTNQ